MEHSGKRERERERERYSRRTADSVMSTEHRTRARGRGVNSPLNAM